MIVRLAHLCFRTSRFAEMTEFYGKTLELVEQFTLNLPDGRVFGRYFALGETSFLEIFDQAGATEMWGGDTGEPRVLPGSTYQHFCLQVTALDALRDRLVGKGLSVTPVTLGMDNSRQAWIKDPDGNDIELMEYTDKSLQIAEKA